MAVRRDIPTKACKSFNYFSIWSSAISLNWR